MRRVFLMMFYSAKQNAPDIVGDVLLLLFAYPLFCVHGVCI